jgi:hypothetical protein
MSASHDDGPARIVYEQHGFGEHEEDGGWATRRVKRVGTGLQVAFDRRLKLEFHGATVTADAGLLAFRELDDTLGLTALAADLLHDPRTGGTGATRCSRSSAKRCSGDSPATRT